MRALGPRREGAKVIAALATVYVVWGSTYLAIRVMVQSIPPLLGTGARFLAAAVILAGWVTSRGAADWKISRREALNASCTGVFILVGGIGLVGVAEQRVPSAIAAVVIASIPLWVVLLQAALGQRPSARTLAAVTVGLVGIGAMFWPAGRFSAETGAMLLLVVAALSTAVGVVFANRAEMPPNPLVAATVEMFVAGIALCAAAAATGEMQPEEVAAISAASLGAFFYLVTAGSLLAYSAFAWLLRNASPSTVATYAFVNPVVAVILGAVILDEEITGRMLLAAAAIVASVFFVVRTEQQ